MKDIRYSEMLFLLAVAKERSLVANRQDAAKFWIDSSSFNDMVCTLAEELYVLPRSIEAQILVAHLRGEWSIDRWPGVQRNLNWTHPREGLRNLFGGGSLQTVEPTYRGLRRIEELRDLLKHDRVLEPFGIVLDVRYLQPDLREQLAQRDVPVSVIRLDLDGFKRINDDHGHYAGDEVLKAYLTAVRDTIGDRGTSYRAGGDEVAAVVAGLDKQDVLQLAERLRAAVAGVVVEYKNRRLPPVTASIGIASSPPGPRTPDLESMADDAQGRAKREGKNRVVDGTAKA